MDYEKKYKEALERARKCWGEYNELVGAYENKGVCEEIFPELRESEDEKIRKELKTLFLGWINGKSSPLLAEPCNRYIAWLEEQGEHKKFRDSIQVGDKVTKNEDGVLVNLSQLKRVAKKDENQGEQKPTDKVEPKFKIGDWVVRNGKTLQISGIDTVLDGTFHYWFTKGTWLSSKKMENAMLWTIQDAKDGDVVVDKSDGTVGIFQSIGHHPDGGSYNDPSYCFLHCRYDDGFFYADFDDGNTIDSDDLIPATKEQRDKLEKAMADAGYTFDFEKKELEKIEQKQEWSEEDNQMIKNVQNDYHNRLGAGIIPQAYHDKVISWLKSLKDRVQPQNRWKPSDEQMKALEETTNEQWDVDGDALWHLYQDLKKLREE